MDDGSPSVEKKIYRGMTGSLLNLTASKLDIAFSVCLCARFQSMPRESHLKAVKRIFGYLKHTLDLALWYPKGCNFDLAGYADADYAGFLVDRNSTSGWLIFLDPVWYLGQPRNYTLLPCPQHKLNMLQLLLVVLNCFG